MFNPPPSVDGPHYRALLDVLDSFVGTPHEQFVWDTYFDWSRIPDRDRTNVSEAATAEGLSFAEYVARETLNEIRYRLRQAGLPEWGKAVSPEGNNGRMAKAESRPDGPEDPYWLWWKGKRYSLGSNRKRQAYELLTFFWSCESATFQELVGPGKPWTEAVEDHAFSNAASNFNNDLPRGFPWKLRTGGRRMFKEKISLKSCVVTEP